MLYYLHRWSEDFGLLNVFQYQTFRAAAAGLTAFLLCLAFSGWVIRRLVSLKLGQPIRTQEEVIRRQAGLRTPARGAQEGRHSGNDETQTDSARGRTTHGGTFRMDLGDGQPATTRQAA